MYMYMCIDSFVKSALSSCLSQVEVLCKEEREFSYTLRYIAHRMMMCTIIAALTSGSAANNVLPQLRLYTCR